MESHSKSKDRKTSKVNACLSSQMKQTTKLGSLLNVDERIYDDFHPQYADKSKGLTQKQQVERKSRKSDELVMYMSSLPNYLEKGENPKEKHFNIGVLDWGLLQKWQHSNNDVVGTRLKPLENDGIVSGLKGKDVIQKGEALKIEKQNLEKMNSGLKARKSDENEDFEMKKCVSEPTKVRNPSPTRRFSFGISRIGKSSCSNSSNLVPENIHDSSLTDTRARSSPLRRLLDPILKPKGVESRDVSRSSERKNPSKTDKALKLSTGKTEFPAGRTSGLKNGVHALLQVAMKNGLPLFTFTVDNCGDILAATVKEVSSSKTTSGWIYTFFSFTETKRKNSSHWINQGSKDRNHGYIPNIIAQMKVSDISTRREFVLSSVGPGDVKDLFPGNELAAVVFEFPERKRGTLDIPQATTVILPGGHHGAPSKGEPSPLIERWKSGGLCDCGGWDLGCRLRTLANKNELNQQTKSQLADFKLFSQEEDEEQRPVFVLSPFDDGMFSVEFSSLLKPVQAFSVGISVVHSRTSAFVSSPSVFGDTEEIIVSKILNQAQLQVSTKYATNPPLSPVGRV